MRGVRRNLGPMHGNNYKHMDQACKDSCKPKILTQAHTRATSGVLLASVLYWRKVAGPEKPK